VRTPVRAGYGAAERLAQRRLGLVEERQRVVPEVDELGREVGALLGELEQPGGRAVMPDGVAR
jgi:hypothetical protein